MPIVATENLLEGMILAEAAVASGREILPAGARICGDAAAKLAGAGVARVRVTEESRNPAARTDLEQIARMFAEHGEDRLMNELCRLAVKCAKERPNRA